MTDEMLKNVWPEWQIVSEIGRGSFGEVYKAVRREYSAESYAVIKVIRIPQNEGEINTLRSEGLSPESVKEYLQGIVMDMIREIQAIESLQATQNIVCVEDYEVIEKSDGLGWTIFIQMELLTPLLIYAFDHEMSEAEVIKLGTDLCSALELCEKRQIIHRGIKPDHIFRNDFGKYKLGGFEHLERLVDLTGGIFRQGRCDYLAPEAARGDNCDKTVDLYSLGLVLYRLLNRNQPPFLEIEQQLKNPGEFIRALQRRMNGEPLNSPCDASPAMAEVILKACAYQPSDRYASATEMKHALMSVANGTYRSQQKNSNDSDPATAVHSDSDTAVHGDSATTVQSDSATAVQKPVKDGRKRKITILVSAVCAAIVLAILLKTVFVPNYRYREAVALYNAGQYEEAITAFEALEGYKDSENQIEKCNTAIKNVQYNAAVALYDEGNYHEAIVAFEEMNDYRDSRTQIENCITAIKETNYKTALAFYRDGKYEEAIIAFEEINGYKDSKAQIEKCTTAIKDEQYNAAVALYDKGKYEEAITAFKEMNGYKDSKTQIEKCRTAIKDEQYNAAVALYDKGKYEEAITAFEKMNGYKDSKTQIKKCKTAIKDEQYNAAVALYDKGKYEEAITAFEKMNGYKDSKTQIEKCKTAIKDEQYNAAVALYDKGKYEEAITEFEELDGYRDSAEKVREISRKLAIEFLKIAKVGDTVTFGEYEQNNYTLDGQEEIEWIVLDREKDRLLLVSKYALDCQQYHSFSASVTWEICDLRKWLNETFLERAFTSTEQMMIASTSVSADRNPKYDADTGKATKDKIFLLSITEADEYFSSNEARKCVPTAYAEKRGVYANSEYTIAGGKATCWWWLRSPGIFNGDAAGGDRAGVIDDIGLYVNYDGIGVRPALWINLNA